MATERQIAANRRNATRSTGPRSAGGKARCRANATKHGLAGRRPEVEAGLSPEFADRRAEWSAGMASADPAARWAMDCAVAASLRIDRCGRALERVIAGSRERAGSSWEGDREVEAGLIYGRLARDPVLASRQLRTSLAGVSLLIGAWRGLIGALQAGEDWSEEDQAMALDLLGVDPGLRKGRRRIDPLDGTPPVAFRRALATEEVGRLEALRAEGMAPLDELDRRAALAGDIALLSKPASLVLRYERDAWRRYDRAMGQVRGGSGAAEPASKPAEVPAPGVSREGRAGLDVARPSTAPGPVAPAEGPSSDLPTPDLGAGAGRRRLAKKGRRPRKAPDARKVPHSGARPTRPSPHPYPVADGEKCGKVGTPDRGSSHSDGKPDFADSGATIEQGRRELLAAARPFVRPVIDGLRAMGLHDEDAWLEELDRRVAAGPGGYGVTEQTRLAVGPADRGPAAGGPAPDQGLGLPVNLRM